MGYPVVQNGFPSVFNLLLEAIALQNINDSYVQEKTFSFGIASRNTTKTAITIGSDQFADRHRQRSRKYKALIEGDGLLLANCEIKLTLLTTQKRLATI